MLTYSVAVNEATWDAIYDIYVKMDTKEKPVKVNYKAAILQNTGEVWVIFSFWPLVLTHTFSVGKTCLSHLKQRPQHLV